MTLLFKHLPTAAFAAFLAWIVFLADTSRPSVFFSLVKWIPLGDKLGHLILFGTLAWLFNRSLRYRLLVGRPLVLPLGSVLALVIAAGEELTQLAFPNRNFDLADLAADFVGIAIFSWIQWMRRNRRIPEKIWE
ncbi:MAG: VanZ family protein [Verrucomicrobia bacterium]|nr:VanZ family protein [Verrucomicrobiota bacterium]